MLLRRITDFLLRGRLESIGTAFVTAFIPFIGSISILIAALVTLRKGAFEGALVLIAATVPYLISYFASTATPDQAQLALAMFGVVILSNVLTWLFAVILRKYSNWSFTLELSAFLGVLAVGIVHLIYPEIQNWWGAQLQVYFAKTMEAVGTANKDTVAVANELPVQAIQAAKQYVTGFIAVSILFNALLQLVIARWWQAIMFNPGGLRKELYQIRFGHIAGLVFVFGLVLAYFGNSFALDAMPVLYVMFFLAGISLLHRLIGVTRNSWLWIILIYMGIIWLFPLSLVIIAMIALLDSGVDFRKRFLL
jgi:hypothetical protein